jgi:hypothetical protein
LIVGARLKSRGDLAGMIGWHSRNLHHVKKLPDLSEYLTPAPPADKQAEIGARAAKHMFSRMIKKQEAKHGDR